MPGTIFPVDKSVILNLKSFCLAITYTLSLIASTPHLQVFSSLSHLFDTSLMDKKMGYVA